LEINQGYTTMHVQPTIEILINDQPGPLFTEEFVESQQCVDCQGLKTLRTCGGFPKLLQMATSFHECQIHCLRKQRFAVWQISVTAKCDTTLGVFGGPSLTCESISCGENTVLFEISCVLRPCTFVGGQGRFFFFSSSSSALQLFMSFGLLNYFFPLFPLLRPLFPLQGRFRET
jgi:hypothetical protein